MSLIEFFFYILRDILLLSKRKITLPMRSFNSYIKWAQLNKLLRASRFQQSSWISLVLSECAPVSYLQRWLSHNIFFLEKFDFSHVNFVVCFCRSAGKLLTHIHDNAHVRLFGELNTPSGTYKRKKCTAPVKWARKAVFKIVVIGKKDWTQYITFNNYISKGWIPGIPVL